MILILLALTAFGVLLELACDAFAFVGEFLKEDAREIVGLGS